MHWHKAAYRDIQTFKAHLISCLCDSDPQYLAKERYHFPPQEKITLNLLCNCCFNTKVSVYAELRDVFDYNKTPLTPLGTRGIFR